MSERTLENKVAFVTGASRGIGRAIATGLAREGMHVALLARNRERLVETAQECEAQRGKRALVLPHDLAESRGIEEKIERAFHELGGLHVLVNDAGVGGGGVCDQADLDAWDRVIDVNLRSLMHLTRLALPFIERGDWGAVVNIASVAGKMPMGGSAAYSASKHGVVGFTGALFEDVRERNIKVCAICPGFVNTDMVRSRHLDDEKMIQPEDILNAVLFVLRYPDNACPTEITIRPQRSPSRAR